MVNGIEYPSPVIVPSAVMVFGCWARTGSVGENSRLKAITWQTIQKKTRPLRFLVFMAHLQSTA